MGASNFYFKNILAVMPDFNIYDEQDYAIDFDSHAHNFFVRDLQEDLEKIGLSSSDGKEKESEYNSSYCGHIISEIDFYFSDGNIYKTIEVVSRIGYYEGGNIDYNIIDHGYEGKTKNLDKKIEAKIKQIKKVIFKHCTEYKVTARFSNGETWYAKVAS